MSSARVRSIETLADFKSALCTFAAEAREALSSLEMDIRRAEDFLADQAKHWGAAVRQCEDRVFQARQELARRRMMRIGDRPPDCTEQEEAFENAQRRLAYAEEKLEATTRWLRQLPEAVIDYKGPVNQLVGVLDVDLPKADALLAEKIASLEEYVRLAAVPPSLPGRDVLPSPSGRGAGGERSHP